MTNKGLKQVGNVNHNARLHPYFTLMCDSASRDVDVHCGGHHQLVSVFFLAPLLSTVFLLKIFSSYLLLQVREEVVRKSFTETFMEERFLVFWLFFTTLLYITPHTCTRRDGVHDDCTVLVGPDHTSTIYEGANNMQKETIQSHFDEFFIYHAGGVQ